MNQKSNRTNPPRQPTARPKPPKPKSQEQQTQETNITQEIIDKIDSLERGLKYYPIRELVNDAENFGYFLNEQNLKTNQIRKFLDALNRLKFVLAQENDFSKIETEVVLLKPKLVYAAAREKAVKPLSDVMSKAIDRRVHDSEDFERLVQLLESIIAYHKAKGGE